MKGEKAMGLRSPFGISFIISIALLAMLTACARKNDLDGASLRRLEVESSEMLAHLTPANTTVPASDWPRAIDDLRPRQVYVNEHGIFITLNEFFVAESGYFIPRDRGRSWESPRTDPAYIRIKGNVYWYEIQG
jgi:hypothetical protein